MQKLVVVCADIGSVLKGNFGWWASSDHSDKTPSSLARFVAEKLHQGSPVALGFECPLFVAIGRDEKLLTKGRPGEGSRAWSAGAGCGALATGLVQVPWILREIRTLVSQPPSPYLDWTPFTVAKSGLFLWEAFVTGKAKGANHIADAQTGAKAFSDALPDPRSKNAVVWNEEKPEIYSLIGSALLHTSWSSDPEITHRPCLVISA